MEITARGAVVLFMGAVVTTSVVVGLSFKALNNKLNLQLNTPELGHQELLNKLGWNPNKITQTETEPSNETY